MEVAQRKPEIPSADIPQESLRLLLPYLSKREIRTCRGVAKSWKEVIDSQLEDSLYGGSYVRTHAGPTRTTIFRFVSDGRCTCFRRAEDVTRFTLDFEEEINRQKNPFPGRKIIVNFQGGTGVQQMEFYNRLLTLVTRTGRHIWAVEIKPSVDQRPPLNQSLLFSAVLRMPNLRHLRISGKNNDWISPPTYPHFVVNIGVRVDSQSPRLGGLEISRNALPRDVVLNLIDAARTDVRPLRKNITRNLSDLVVFHWGRQCPGRPIEEKLHTIRAPELERLTVASNCIALPDFTDAVVIQLGTRFPKLRHLEWKGNIGVYPETSDPSLPNITSLTVHNEFVSCYDFLRKFPNLERLMVILSEGGLNCEKIRNDFNVQMKPFLHSKTEEFESSNIWQILPNLQMVSIMGENACQQYPRPNVVANGRWKSFKRLVRKAFQLLAARIWTSN